MAVVLNLFFGILGSVQHITKVLFHVPGTAVTWRGFRSLFPINEPPSFTIVGRRAVCSAEHPQAQLQFSRV
jgi:hypothetical protein